MLQSMTGYGKAEAEFEGKKVTIEVKSLNSKQADMSTRLPLLYREKDLEIRNMLAQSLQRGKIDFSITVDNRESEVAATINAAAFEAYRKQIVSLAGQNGLPVPEDMFALILRLPEVMKNEQSALPEEEWETVRNGIQTAIDRLDAFRVQEGAGLEKFFTERLDAIENLLVNEVPQYESVRVERIRTRLEDGLREIGEKITYDANRLEQELIFYIEKLDISEEKQRLANHIKYFRSTMLEEPGQGKKLGFIAQEMGREINTLGSKSNHAELQVVVVKMKDELEKIKEQVLNVL